MLSQAAELDQAERPAEFIGTYSLRIPGQGEIETGLSPNPAPRVAIISDLHAFFIEGLGGNFSWPSTDVLMHYLDKEGITHLIFNGDFLDSFVQRDTEKILDNGGWHHFLTRLIQRMVDPDHALEEVIFLEGNHDPLADLEPVKKYMLGQVKRNPERKKRLEAGIIIAENMDIEVGNLNVRIEHGHNIFPSPGGETALLEKLAELNQSDKKRYLALLKRWQECWLRRLVGAGIVVSESKIKSRKYREAVYESIKNMSNLAIQNESMAETASSNGSECTICGHSHDPEVISDGKNCQNNQAGIFVNTGLWNHNNFNIVVLDAQGINLSKLSIHKGKIQEELIGGYSFASEVQEDNLADNVEP